MTATEFKFKFSRTNIPTGTVIFTVVNKGKIAHDFKIAGKNTLMIAAGKSANLTVKFTKGGKFAYLCTIPGHAAAGMKGLLQVGTTPVAVSATEFKFKLSRLSVPIGPVTFTVTNKGKIAHDFKIAGKKTPTLSPGKSFKLTVSFTKKGRYPFLCTLPGHAAAGMKGTFSVAAPAVTPPPPTTTTPPVTTTPPTTTTPGGPETLMGDPAAGHAVFDGERLCFVPHVGGRRCNGQRRSEPRPGEAEPGARAHVRPERLDDRRYLDAGVLRHEPDRPQQRRGVRLRVDALGTAGAVGWYLRVSPRRKPQDLTNRLG